MTDSPDRPLLDLIRRRGSLTVPEMAAEFGVTPTSIRNRLTRLVASGLVERSREPGGRGRPRHAYRVSDAVQKSLGQNYADLALALWGEMMQTVEDRKLRRLLFLRIIERLAETYRARVSEPTLEGRLAHLSILLHNQGIEAEVATSRNHGFPILRQHSCPYFALAEVDRAICAMERKMLEKVLGRGLRLSQCRLDGHHSCDFEPKPLLPSSAPPTSTPAPPAA